MRRTLMATTGVLALGAGLIVPATASLAADTDTSIAAVDAGKRTGVKLTLKGPKTDPVAGDAVTVKGKTTVKKQPVAKAKVKLLRKKGSKWVAVGKTTTNNKGKYRKQVTLPNKPKVDVRAKLVKPTRIKGATSKTLTLTFAQPAQPPAPTTPAPSDTSSPAPTVTAPDTPTNVTAVAGNGQVKLTWTPPANNGGAAITGYRIETKTDGPWTIVTTTNDSLAATVPATNGQRHSYRVTAITSAGDSEISAATEPVLPVDPEVCLVHDDDYTVLTYSDGAVQSAINDPNSDNDTLTISGTCYEHDITVTKTVTLTGTGTIDADQQGRVVHNQGNVTITGDLTITRGNTGDGGGIYNDGSSATVTINGNAEISGNTANRDGGGIFNNLGAVTLHGGTISGNTADSTGGGIGNNDGTVTIHDGTITNNNAGDGGGIYNNGDSATVTLSGGTITNNTASYGGGIYNDLGRVTLNGNATLSGNTAVNGQGGGIYNTGGIVSLNTVNTVDLSDAPSITGNKATLDLEQWPTAEGEGLGGGIYNASGTIALYGASTIHNNEAGYGAGIYNYGTVTLTDTASITSNLANYEGGGLYNFGALSLTGTSAISDNSAQIGGGIYSTGGSASVTMNSNSGVANNEAYYDGGGIYNVEASSVTLDNSATVKRNTTLDGFGRGGGIYNDGTVTLNGGTITSNTADNGGDGGGIYNARTVTLNGGTIGGETEAAANRAALGGGVYNNGGTVTLDGGAITGNEATAGGGIYNDGLVTLTSGTITGNDAAAGGGGIYNANSGTTTLDGGTITGNEANLGGGIFNRGTVNLDGGTITGNTASIGGDINNDGGTVNP